ncbi:MAG: RNA polymerase subunit sigma [Salinivirgaceae bacterium]|nr:MAG: RNA polymerase subunit sigma [Salinivirgaceae bacterium]
MNTIQLTDEYLMLDVRRGNLDALGPLFEKYHVELFNYFLRRCRNRELSEDLTQNVFQRIIKYRSSFRDDSVFKPWMYKIAQNIMYSHYRKLVPEDEFKDTEQLADSPEGSEQVLQDKLLFEALSQLPEQDRELIELSRFQGLKYAEISEITGNSVSAIKVKIHRAIGKLRELYFQTV